MSTYEFTILTRSFLYTILHQNTEINIPLILTFLVPRGFLK